MNKLVALLVQVVKLAREARASDKWGSMPTRYFIRHTVAMAAKLQTHDVRGKYRRCNVIVEPPNAWIKQMLRFRQFSLRGIDKVRCEFKLVCAALNLRRVASMRL